MPYADKERQREYNRNWIAARRAQWLAANGPCARCKTQERLTIDHIDPRAKVAHSVWSWTKSRRLAELAKCQVLCESCHLKKSITNGDLVRNRPAVRHGTLSMYGMRGCRCEPCKDARARQYQKEKAKKAA